MKNEQFTDDLMVSDVELDLFDSELDVVGDLISEEAVVMSGLASVRRKRRIHALSGAKPELQIASPEAKRPKMSAEEYDDAANSIVAVYGDSVFVHRELGKYRKLPAWSVTDSRKIAALEAGAYRQLDDSEQTDHFRLIDKGFNLYARSADLERLSVEDERTMEQFAASWQILYHTNLALVHYAADKFDKSSSSSLDFTDLFQEGAKGLMKAINRNEVSRGYKFSTYAVYWIKQGITRTVAEQSRQISISTYRHGQYKKINSTINSLWQELRREPTVSEISTATSMSEEQVNLVLRCGVEHLTSLDMPLGENSEGTLADIIKDDHPPEVDQLVDKLGYGKIIDELAESADIDSRTKAVLGLRHGVKEFQTGDFSFEVCGETLNYSDVVGDEGLGLKDIGDLLGITRERARQLESRGVLKMRAADRGNRYKELLRGLIGVSVKSADH